MLILRTIDRTNYMDCILLQIAPEQTLFVADNARSLAEAAYEEGLHPLAVYADTQMVGFLLYDYDPDIPGWSLSRFMIDRRFQGQGYGRQALLAFLDLFQREVGADSLYISVHVDNAAMRRLAHGLGFTPLEELSYTFQGVLYRETRMVKRLSSQRP